MLAMVANAGSRLQRLTTEEVLMIYQRRLSTSDPVIKNQLRALGIELAGNERLQ